jgi:hypothetical protein
MMEINTLAEKYHVKTWRDECNNTVIVGKHGNVCDGFNGGRLGVYLTFGTARKWNHVRRALEAAGMVVKQNTETEGCLTFDLGNGRQCRLALKQVGARIRRQAGPPSMAQLAVRQAFASRHQAHLSRWLRLKLSFKAARSRTKRALQAAGCAILPRSRYLWSGSIRRVAGSS